MTTKKSSYEAEFENEEDLAAEEAAAADKARAKAEFASMLDDSLKGSKKRFNIGDKVKGEILVIGKEVAFVSLGGQKEGQISRRDLLNEQGEVTYKVGDRVELFVTGVKGQDIFLSPKPTSKNIAEDIQEAYDMGMAVEGRVSEVVKGGFRVLINGKPAFCPISQLDSVRIETPEDYIGKKYEFMVTQFSEGGRNIVVSRRKLLDEQKSLTEGSFLAEHKAGDLVSGKIKRLEKFGAFVEVAPGVEGLAHISELSWSRVNDPADVISVGQEMPVKILKIENAEGRTRISLSIKQAGGQPWEALPSRIEAGQVVEGKVTRCVNAGADLQTAIPETSSSGFGTLGDSLKRALEKKKK